eukprot:700495-Rhodomonas_salina.2
MSHFYEYWDLSRRQSRFPPHVRALMRLTGVQGWLRCSHTNLSRVMLLLLKGTWNLRLPQLSQLPEPHVHWHHCPECNHDKGSSFLTLLSSSSLHASQKLDFCEVMSLWRARAREQNLIQINLFTIPSSFCNDILLWVLTEARTFA